MRYIVEITIPEYIEVEAPSEEQAIEVAKNSIQDVRIRDYAKYKVCKEATIS